MCVSVCFLLSLPYHALQSLCVHLRAIYDAVAMREENSSESSDFSFSILKGKWRGQCPTRSDATPRESCFFAISQPLRFKEEMTMMRRMQEGDSTVRGAQEAK